MKNYRRCISCRKFEPKEAFWRIVRVYPTNQVQLDQGMGRSAYLCPEADCLKAAQKKNRLERALRVSVPPNLYKTLWQRLATSPSKTLVVSCDNIPVGDINTPQ
ncbi:MAG: YlxR family protein [Microcoleaceae cyanobacterium]